MSWIRRGWTQGAFCRNENGTPVPPDTLNPKRVDLAWALSRAARDCGADEQWLRWMVRDQLPEPYKSDEHFGVERWNDVEWRTRTEVIIVLERVARGLDVRAAS